MSDGAKQSPHFSWMLPRISSMHFFSCPGDEKHLSYTMHRAGAGKPTPPLCWKKVSSISRVTPHRVYIHGGVCVHHVQIKTLGRGQIPLVAAVELPTCPFS